MKNTYPFRSFGLAICIAMGIHDAAVAQSTSKTPLPAFKEGPARIHQDTEQPLNMRGGLPNDNCASAIVLTVNGAGACPGAGVAGDNFGANSDNGTPACDVTETAFEDVWYSFNSGTSTSVTIAIELGDIEDVVVEVLQGSCAGASVYCSFSTLEHVVTVSPSTNYLIRVASNNDFGFGGTFTICITGAGGGSGPANNECPNATAISVNSTCVSTPGTTEGATQSQAPATCSTFTASVANDVWYSFTATAASTTVQVTGSGDATTGMDPVLEVFSGACGALASLGCIDATVRGGTESLTVATVPGTQYRYRVYYWPYAAPQTVFGFTTCVIAAGGGPGYCTAGADGTGLGLEERIINVTFGNINNSSPDASPVSPAYSDFTGVVGNVTAGQTYPIAIDVARNGANTSYDSNQALVWIDFNQDLDFNDPGEQVFVSAIGSVDIYSGNITIPPGTPAGSTRMRIRLHDTHDGSQYTNNFNDTPCGLASYGEVEDYTLSISGGGAAPANDDCTGAVAVALSTPGSITLSGDNTGATIDPPTPYTVVWEAFTITECSNVTINYCQPGSEFEAFFINVVVNCPDILNGILEGPNDGCNVFFTNLQPGTYYIPVRVESDGTTPQGVYSIQVSAEPCPPPGPYCDASANSLAFEKISNVTFAGINNASTSTAGYEDFTNVVGTVVGGQAYQLTVTVAGGFATDQVLAWIDWNQDSDFNDADEQVFVSPNGTGPFNGLVNVPLTAAQGTTRMRIRLHDTYVGPDYFNFPNPTPCDTSTYGQVEDYTIDMIGVVTGAAALEAGALTVFPNPSHGDMTIVYSGAAGHVTIDLLDATGRLVHAEQLAVADGALVPLALGGRLAHGAYTLRLRGPDGGLRQQRIVIH